jgi:hypothetical protein
VLANEVFLLLQGVYALAGRGWENAGIYLFAASLAIFAGLLLLFIRQFRYDNFARPGLPAGPA